MLGPMLHTKFRGNRSTGSDEDLSRIFTIYGHGGHLGHVTQMPRTNFNSPVPWRLYTKFGVDWPCVIVIEEKMIEIATGSWVYD